VEEVSVRYVRMLLFALLLCACVPVFAGPPFLTDDPEAIGFRHWEFYLFSALDRGPDATSVQGPAVELNFGTSANTFVHLVVPVTWNDPRNGAATSGVGDAELGFKYRFVHSEAHGFEMGLFPMAELPTGSASRGLGNGRAWFRIPLWVQKTWGTWTTYGGGGYAVNHAPGQRDYPFGGWLVQKGISERFTLGAEVFAQGADTVDGQGFALVNWGGYVNFSPHFSLLFSAGRTFRGEHHGVAYLGLYWTWGPGK
jgi:hypothetical protein